MSDSERVLGLRAGSPRFDGAGPDVRVASYLRPGTVLATPFWSTRDADRGARFIPRLLEPALVRRPRERLPFPLTVGSSHYWTRRKKRAKQLLLIHDHAFPFEIAVRNPHFLPKKIQAYVRRICVQRVFK